MLDSNTIRDLADYFIRGGIGINTIYINGRASHLRLGDEKNNSFGKSGADTTATGVSQSEKPAFTLIRTVMQPDGDFLIRLNKNLSVRADTYSIGSDQITHQELIGIVEDHMGYVKSKADSISLLRGLLQKAWITFIFPLLWGYISWLQENIWQVLIGILFSIVFLFSRSLIIFIFRIYLRWKLKNLMSG